MRRAGTLEDQSTRRKEQYPTSGPLNEGRSVSSGDTAAWYQCITAILMLAQPKTGIHLRHIATTAELGGGTRSTAQRRPKHKLGDCRNSCAYHNSFPSFNEGRSINSGDTYHRLLDDGSGPAALNEDRSISSGDTRKRKHRLTSTVVRSTKAGA